MHFQIVLNQFHRLLPKGEIARNISILAGSSAFGQIVSVLAAPIITRLYSPSDYGVVAAFGSVAAMALVIATLRFEWAIPNPDEDEVAINLLVVCFGVMVIVAVSSVAVVRFVSSIFGKVITVSVLEPYFWLLPLYVLGGASYQALNGWAIRKKNFKAIAKTRVSQSLAGSGFNIGLGLLEWGSLGLLLGGLAGQTVGIGTFGTSVWREDRSILLRVNMSGMKNSFKRYWKFACLSTGVGIVNTACFQVVPILLTTFYGPIVVGWYALAQRIIGIPSQLIGQASGQTFWAESARLVREDPVGLKRLFFTFSRKLATISLLIAAVGLISPFAFGFVFGKERWTMAGYYALYLTPMIIAQFIASTTSHLVVHELQHWQLVWDSARLIFIIVLFLIANSLHLTPDTSILIYSLFMSCMYGILYLMNKHAIELKIKGLAAK